MAKAAAVKRKTKQSKVVTSEVADEGDNADTDSQMDDVIEVKGSASTVTVSWDKNEEGDDTEKRTNSSDDQMMESAGAVGSTEDAPGESSETKKKQEMQESGESQMDTVAEDGEGAPTATVTLEKKNDEGEGGDIKKETNGGEQKTVKKKAAKGKRKAPSADETSPSKKTKLINDGFCVFVGNLDNSKTFEEVKDSLASYFMTQSLLVQDIRLDRSRKHAFVDLASEMDLTKALALNGEMMHDKPMKIDKAKIKSEDKVKVKPPPEDQKVIDARCLFLKNVPYNATKQDILKIFHKAIAVRFPGGAAGPEKGIAFVEFRKKTIAKKILQKKRMLKIQGRVLIVDSVGETNVPEVAKANDDNDDDDDDNKEKAPAAPNKTLFVSNLSYDVKDKDLKKVFPKAVSIKVPPSKGKSRGFAFVQFASVAEAEKVLQSMKNIQICKREAKLQFWEAKSEKTKVLSKTLMVLGLSEKTSAGTLKSAFEGALAARIAMDKKTGASKKLGFVDFENEESCEAAKEAMEDCEIDGSKVTVVYAKPKGHKRLSGASKGIAGRPGGKPAGRGAGKAGRGIKKGKGHGAGRPRVAVKKSGKSK